MGSKPQSFIDEMFLDSRFIVMLILNEVGIESAHIYLFMFGLTVPVLSTAYFSYDAIDVYFLLYFLRETQHQVCASGSQSRLNNI